MPPRTFILIECVDPRVKEGQSVTTAVIMDRLGQDAVALHHHTRPGVTALLAGERHILNREMELMAHELFMHELAWNIAEVEKHGSQVDYVIVAGHDAKCSAECGDDLCDPGITMRHINMAISYLTDRLATLKLERKIKKKPSLLAMLQHIAGDTIVSVEFFD